MKLLVYLLACTSFGLVLARDILQPAVGNFGQDKPWFCHDLDCPLFDIVNKTDGYETRKYRPGRWVSTHSEGYAYETAVASGFQDLFQYISGENEGKHKIAMTSPVTVKTTSGQGPACKSDFLVSFFLPYKYQDMPPVPKNSNIFFTDVPVEIVYVGQYGGVMVDDKIIAARATELLDRLKEDGQRFDERLVFTAEYDPPYRLQHRHNEIWVAAGANGGVQTS